MPLDSDLPVLPRLCIVLPCYNEEATLKKTIVKVKEKLDLLIKLQFISGNSCMFFVDDGSQDSTWDIISHNSMVSYGQIQGIRFAANRGKEIALWFGCVEGGKIADLVACMDADLQFDLNALDKFLECYREGYELVYGIKLNRGNENILRRGSARLFYAVMSMLGSPVCNNHTDYCLMTKRVCQALSEYCESHIIFRGLLKNLGFRQKSVEFVVFDRDDGESHFSMNKLISLSIDAITSFSVAPLRIIALVGFCVFLIGALMSSYSLMCFIYGMPPDGYTTLICSIWLLGGLGMLSMGIIGEYLGKIYIEAKKRPRSFVCERVNGMNA